MIHTITAGFSSRRFFVLNSPEEILRILTGYCEVKNAECPIKDGEDAYDVMFAFEDDQMNSV